jgi:hypothetical protein
LITECREYLNSSDYIFESNASNTTFKELIAKCDQYIESSGYVIKLHIMKGIPFLYIFRNHRSETKSDNEFQLVSIINATDPTRYFGSTLVRHPTSHRVSYCKIGHNVEIDFFDNSRDLTDHMSGLGLFEIFEIAHYCNLNPEKSCYSGKYMTYHSYIDSNGRSHFKKTVTAYVEGKKHGKTIWYNKDGLIESEMNYVNGEPDRSSIIWCLIES